MISPSVSPADPLNCNTTAKSLRASVVPSSVVTTQASADVWSLGGENPSEVVLPGANDTGTFFGRPDCRHRRTCHADPVCRKAVAQRRKVKRSPTEYSQLA